MWEDENALVGGDDGADIIRQILDRSPSLLSSNGLRKVGRSRQYRQGEERSKKCAPPHHPTSLI